MDEKNLDNKYDELLLDAKMKGKFSQSQIDFLFSKYLDENTKEEEREAYFALLVEKNYGLLVTIVNNWLSSKNYRSLNRDDLYQDASVALIKAIRYYDPSKGYKFSTYASACIEKFLNNNADAKYIRKLYQNDGSDECVEIISLDANINQDDDSSCFYDVIEDPNAYKEVVEQHTYESFMSVFDKIIENHPHIKEDVIKFLYREGTFDGVIHTWQDTAEHFNTTVDSVKISYTRARRFCRCYKKHFDEVLSE